ncbi:MAG: tryptophan--tRNA ligase [Deltaproteobacteria bacterium]|nr:tryptophan--tRNA ligase [Deltaproteobacteria bacterium]
MNRRPRVFSGMQPTGGLHIGNYLGALKSWVELQDDYDCIYCVVDYHAITIEHDPRDLQARIELVARGYLAAGVDPERSALFVQSAVPEHTELAWVFSSLTPIGLLGRMTQFKDKSKDHEDNVNAGLLTYPILQAADIAIYKSEAVPVGEDQQQHLEFARDVVRKFNLRYGGLFPEPRTILSSAPKVLGLDGERKMSKSLGNDIGLEESADEVWRKLAPAKTDPARVRRTDPGDPEKCNLYRYHRCFSSEQTLQWAAAGCRSAGIGCLDCKRKLHQHMEEQLAPLRERLLDLQAHPDRVREILAAGAARLRPIAQQTMAEVRDRLGIPRWPTT